MAKSFASLKILARNFERSRPAVMGILNATPDSFSDGGQFFDQHTLELSRVFDAAAQMIEDGAEILDVGGESTRPGAAPVSPAQEADRVLPVLECIAGLDVVISLDSSRPEIMRPAADLGVGLINDVRALEVSGAVECVAELGLPVCLMHMQGTPESMQDRPSYTDLQNEVESYLLARAQVCEAYGVLPEHIILDPGFGFGKTLHHNLVLLKRMGDFAGSRYPVLAGLSRKSLIAHIHQQLGETRDVSQRLPGSLALAMIAADNHAAIIRVHDVKETVDLLKVREAYCSV